MGLDQYLQGAHKFNAADEEWNRIYYWRKANQIHGYFDQIAVERKGDILDNCETLILRPHDLRQFINDCKLAVEDYYLRGDSSFAEKVFPPTEGFFFGNTAMDSCYWSQLEDTVVDLEKIMQENDYEYYRYYGWW